MVGLPAASARGHEPKQERWYREVDKTVHRSS